MHLALLHDFRKFPSGLLHDFLSAGDLRLLRLDHLVHDQHGVSVVPQFVHMHRVVSHPPAFLQVRLFSGDQAVPLLFLRKQLHLRSAEFHLRLILKLVLNI